MQVFGHRGSPGFPRFGENTPTSFRKALNAGAAGIELDVRRCADRTIVVIHDATIDRTTNGAGPVSGLSYAQLSRYDAGHGDSIPRLADVLDEFGPCGITNIELKESGMAAEIVHMVIERKLERRVIVSAFDAPDNAADSTANWLELEQFGPLPTALLSKRSTLERIGCDGLINAVHKHRANAIHASANSVTSELLDLSARHGIPVRVWTINNPNEALHWRDLGVEAIFSDSPAACLAALTS
jgi:glycerophosphoryl diester phosphodiesterase